MTHASMKSKLLSIGQAAVLAVTLTACNESPPEPAAIDPPSEPAADDSDARLQPGDHAWTTADGNRMPYVVAGEGDVTVLLVHCWMCDRSFWSAQVPVLAEQYRTIALDLPGHGEATSERDAWTVSQYGDDVAGLIEGLNLTDVVLVGHSMGGPVSLRAAALSGGRVHGIVAVDTLHDAEFEFSGEQMETFMTAFEADFVGTCGSFVQQMFPEEGVEQIVNKVRETGCREESSAIGSALMRNFGDIDMPRWFSEAGVPIRAVNAATPNPTQIETNRKYADFDAVLMEDVGHYPHMTRPEQFNPLLLDAIAEILHEAP
ncbi:MAG: alpha/beta hydrolase [Woeseia sp.]